MSWLGSEVLEDPVFDSVREVALRFAVDETLPTVAELDARLADRLRPVRLEAQPDKRPRPRTLEDLYVGSIVLRGVVPTRQQNLHDVCNAWIWSSFPQSKRALSARLLEAHIRARGDGPIAELPSRRTREEDTLAMLDEGAVVLLGDEERLRAVRERWCGGDANGALAALRDGVAAHVFGHALLEHRLSGDATVRAMPCFLSSATSTVDAADAALAHAIANPKYFRTPARVRGMSLGWLFGQR